MPKKVILPVIISALIFLFLGTVFGWFIKTKTIPFTETETNQKQPVSDNKEIEASDQVITDNDIRNSGAPLYSKTVMDSYRDLMAKSSIYNDLPKKGSGIRLGIYQAQASWGEGASAKNMDQLEQAVKLAKKYNVQLLSFPELYVPGYTLSPEQAKEVAEYKDGPSIARAKQIAKDNNMALLVPYAEKSDEFGGTKYYDSIAVISENGELLNSYRKTHLYGQQERDNWDFGGNDYLVYSIFGFPVGVINCYEVEFPELSRILALNGAKLVIAPTAADNYYVMTNRQRSDVAYPDITNVIAPANAYQNEIFFAYSNRPGYEKREGNVWHYRGNSIIIGPHGDTIVKADNEQDTLLIADCIPAFYGDTHPEPNYFYLKDRRPELYNQLISKESDFFDRTSGPLTLETNFLDGGYIYPANPENEEK